MPGDFRHQASAASYWVRLISCIVPPDSRSSWRRRQQAALASLRILEDRGELGADAPVFLAAFCRRAFADAFLLRYGAVDPRQWVREPAFLIAAAFALLLSIAACSHGFAATRSLIESFPRAGARPFSDRLVGNSIPIAWALASGIIVAIGRVGLSRRNWRHLSFLLLKTITLAAILVALWIEGGAALRSAIPMEVPRALIGGLLLAALFVAAFNWMVLWSLADQQHRCPVCLRRLVLPVRIGTWASVFEPVTTEWVCEAGHGSLSMGEADPAKSAHWAGLEAEPAFVSLFPRQ